MSELRFPINEHDHTLGPDDAPVTLLEYGDYQCPHCHAAWPQVELVLQQFGSGLRYAYRHFPISTVHPLAKPAAETAEFAGAHGLFWQMHAAIYANGHQLSGATLAALARALGLDVADLQRALDQGTYAAKVETDFTGGVRSGVNGTPCFFVNGLRHDGGYDGRHYRERSGRPDRMRPTSCGFPSDDRGPEQGDPSGRRGRRRIAPLAAGARVQRFH